VQWTLALLLSACTGMTSNESRSQALGKRDSETAPLRHATADAGAPWNYQSTRAALDAGQFLTVEPELRRLVAGDSVHRAAAEVLLAEVELLTGRVEAALARAKPYCNPEHAQVEPACLVVADAMHRRGELDAALVLLAPLAERQASKAIRLAYADLLRERGRMTEARVAYRSLIDDKSPTRQQPGDPRSASRDLAIQGRAAHRLGAWREANDIYDELEQAGRLEPLASIWRAELYLDAHDSLHARAISDELLAQAPEHPRSLALAARVRSTGMQDTADAESIARKLLTVDASLGEAHAILAGLALRDLDFERTAFYLDRGLRFEPANLDLLSTRAAAAFLADDPVGFDAAIAAVLRQNGAYAKLFRVVAEYAESEHRYADTVPLLRRALSLDPDDPSVRAALGMQLLRAGDELEGRRQLEFAFAMAPFDVRVKNTLVLYEQRVDKDYTTLQNGQFAIRMPREFEPVLGSIVKRWLDESTRELQKHYGRLSTTRLNVELYRDLDSFGVRTSGVPTTFLQGVCFGNTVVARLPTDEPTNLGMTLWHELSHVYHLRLSKHRVPRWFTEGLAEVETARQRVEWSREQELSVYQALSEGRIPSIRHMNRAFSHAASLDDLAVAYAISTYFVDYVVERHGYDSIRRLLIAWGKGTSTEIAMSTVFGASVDTLDAEFRAALRKRLSKFDGQFLPKPQPPAYAVARARYENAPADATALADYAHAELLAGHLAKARDLVVQAHGAAEEHPDILWIESLLAGADQNVEAAERSLRKLLVLNQDGYFVRMQRALLERMRGDPEAERAELLRAHGFHPNASEPLYRLAAMARTSNDEQAEEAALAELARLEETDLAVHMRLVELCLKRDDAKALRAAAAALSYVNPLDAELHGLLARVALQRRDARTAAHEQELARQLAATPAERSAIEQTGRAKVTASKAATRAGATREP
jgi:hypothetical protein